MKLDENAAYSVVDEDTLWCDVRVDYPCGCVQEGEAFTYLEDTFLDLWDGLAQIFGYGVDRRRYVLRLHRGRRVASDVARRGWRGIAMRGEVPWRR